MLAGLMGIVMLLTMLSTAEATELHDGAKDGDIARITALLDAGADPNTRDKWGDTALDLITEDSPIYGTDAYWRLNDAKYNQ